MLMIDSCSNNDGQKMLHGIRVMILHWQAAGQSTLWVVNPLTFLGWHDACLRVLFYLSLKLSFRYRFARFRLVVIVFINRHTCDTYYDLLL